MNEVLDFWFNELSPKDWWRKDEELDRLIEKRFLNTYTSAAQGELWRWRETDEGRLAELIVLDQFSRNIFRDKPKAFAADTLAVTLAIEAVRVKAHKNLIPDKANFLLMPFMHSESKAIQEFGMELFETHGSENLLKFAIAHKKIIDRFGRYPHRNNILGRKSTSEEIEFLKEPGSSF
jgi:uncharacterized protein (DUF924 family)